MPDRNAANGIILIANNVGFNARQLYLIPVENCADCWSLQLADKPDLGVACDEIQKRYRKFGIERRLPT